MLLGGAVKGWLLIAREHVSTINRAQHNSTKILFLSITAPRKPKSARENDRRIAIIALIKLSRQFSAFNSDNMCNSHYNCVKTIERLSRNQITRN